MVTNSVYVRDTRVRRYAEYLAADGHCVDVICLPTESGEEQSRDRHISVYPLSMRRERREGMGLVRNWAVIWLQMTGILTKRALRVRYDVIHVHNVPDFLVFCAWLPKLLGCPIVLNVHDPVPELTRSKLGVPPDHPLVRALTFLERVSIRFSDRVITATPDFRRVLIERGTPAEKITVITNAADPRFFAAWNDAPPERVAGRRFTLLYVGTVAGRYGLDTAVKALPSLVEEIPDILLRVVPKIENEGEALDFCMRSAEELGVADAFRVDKPAPLEEMPLIMADADIGVYPAYHDCHMDTALSLKIPEMAAVGLPIVAARLSVLENLFGDDAIAFFPPGDPEAFAERVLELYRSPKRRRELAARARERSEAISWEKLYERYRELLESLTGGSLAATGRSEPAGSDG